MTPPFALNRFDENGARVRRDRSVERFRVAERNGDEAGNEWPESFSVLRRRARADRGDRASVKVVLENDDLRAVFRMPLTA